MRSAPRHRRGREQHFAAVLGDVLRGLGGIGDGHESEPARSRQRARRPCMAEHAADLAAFGLDDRIGCRRMLSRRELPAEYRAIKCLCAGGVVGREVEPDELTGVCAAALSVGTKRRGLREGRCHRQDHSQHKAQEHAEFSN